MAEVEQRVTARVSAGSLEEVHELIRSERLDVGCTGGVRVGEDGSASVDVVGHRDHLVAMGRRKGITVKLRSKAADPLARMREVGSTTRFEATGGVPRGRGTKIFEGTGDVPER